MKYLVLVLALISNSAFAWGDREQGALTGFVIGAIIGNKHQQPSNPVYLPPPPPQPIYIPPPVVYTYPPQQQLFRQRIDIYIPECNCYRTIEVLTR